MALLAIGRHLAAQRSWWGRGEPTLAEILSDSIVKAVMAADGVNPETLEAQLRSVAQELAAARNAGGKMPDLFE
jgi:hypothetical protein